MKQAGEEIQFSVWRLVIWVMYLPKLANEIRFFSKKPYFLLLFDNPISDMQTPL
jgi:hypothetical protein